MQEGVGGRGWNAPAKKSRENHESKPLIRVAAGSIGPTNADRWVSMETRICPLGPYVPTSSRLSVVGVSATRKAVERERNESSVSLPPARGSPGGWKSPGYETRLARQREKIEPVNDSCFYRSFIE